jgi:serine protease Do
VAVSSVKDDSPAAAAGLRTGMIIEKVGSKKVATPDEFRAALKDVSVENGILMLVRSPRGTQFLVVKKEK